MQQGWGGMRTVSGRQVYQKQMVVECFSAQHTAGSCQLQLQLTDSWFLSHQMFCQIRCTGQPVAASACSLLESWRGRQRGAKQFSQLTSTSRYARRGLRGLNSAVTACSTASLELEDGPRMFECQQGSIDGQCQSLKHLTDHTADLTVNCCDPRHVK